MLIGGIAFALFQELLFQTMFSWDELFSFHMLSLMVMLQGYNITAGCWEQLPPMLERPE